MVVSLDHCKILCYYTTLHSLNFSAMWINKIRQKHKIFSTPEEQRVGGIQTLQYLWHWFATQQFRQFAKFTNMAEHSLP